MSFPEDNKFSKHKDEILTEYWDRLSFEGRYIFTNSMMLQKTLGIDVILQMGSNNKEITIDTKHIRGEYKRLFLEGMSCTVEKFGLKEGWGIKEEGRPDYIMHIMHKHCSNNKNLEFHCHRIDKNCNLCSYKMGHITKAYITPSSRIFEWYRPKYLSGELGKTKKEGYHKESYSNMTDGHNIPIEQMIKEMGTVVCNLKHQA